MKQRSYPLSLRRISNSERMAAEREGQKRDKAMRNECKDGNSRAGGVASILERRKKRTIVFEESGMTVN